MKREIITKMDLTTWNSLLLRRLVLNEIQTHSRCMQKGLGHLLKTVRTLYNTIHNVQFSSSSNPLPTRTPSENSHFRKLLLHGLVGWASRLEVCADEVQSVTPAFGQHLRRPHLLRLLHRDGEPKHWEEEG